jgi:hemoglobin-like flavoprotein
VNCVPIHATILENLENASWLSQHLRALGRKHVDYGVTREMYAWVAECLIATLAEVAADEWSQEAARAWEQALGAIRELMLAGAESAALSDAVA